MTPPVLSHGISWTIAAFAVVRIVVFSIVFHHDAHDGETVLRACRILGILYMYIHPLIAGAGEPRALRRGDGELARLDPDAGCDQSRIGVSEGRIADVDLIKGRLRKVPVVGQGGCRRLLLYAFFYGYNGDGHDHTENADDRDNHHKLDQCESLSIFTKRTLHNSILTQRTFIVNIVY